jgi:hypothetical protein
MLVFFWPLLSLLAWLGAPLIRKKIVQKVTENYPGSSAAVEAVRIGFFRPIVTVSQLRLENLLVSPGQRLDLAADSISISFRRKHLRQGLVVCRLEAADVFSGFRMEKTADDGTGNDDNRAIQAAMIPVILDRLTIARASFRFSEMSKSQPVQVQAEGISIHAERLSALPSMENLPASAALKAKLYGGELSLDGKANMADCAFELQAKLDGIDITQLNDILEAYAKFDVHSGELSLYAEAKGKDGHYSGYVKPVIRQLDVVGPEDKGDSLLRRIWERMIGAAAYLLKNRKHDQLATRIAFQGSYDVRINILQAIAGALGNAFIRALKPGLD